MAAVDTVFEQLGKMSVLELVELKKKIEDEWGITAAAPVAVAAAPAAGGDGAAAAEEQTAFDVVLTNPPYINTADLAHLAAEIGHEPREALDGGPNGLHAYHRIAEGLMALLAPGGMAFVEIGLGQADPVEQLFAAAKLKLDGTVCDLAGIPRCVMLRAGEMRGR